MAKATSHHKSINKKIDKLEK